MKRRGFWQVYAAAGFVSLVVILVTLWASFWGPNKPSDSALQFDLAQLIFTSVGTLAVIFTLLFASQQFGKSQRKPDLRVVFADTSDDTLMLRVPVQGQPLTDLSFALVNRGDALALWFEAVVNISELPAARSYTGPGWAQAREQCESNSDRFVVRSYGNAAVFTTASLEIGTIQFHDLKVARSHKYKVPFRVNGDWGAASQGTLLLELRPA